jgi:hypothetical protein
MSALISPSMPKSKQRGGLTRVVSSMNSTRTWVTPPREPVRPRTPVLEVRMGWGGPEGVRVTLTSLMGCLVASILRCGHC